VDGCRYHSNEHYYCTVKMRHHGEEVYELYMSMTPYALMMHMKAYFKKNPEQPAWQKFSNRWAVMWKGIDNKFSIPQFREKLISTGKSLLVEKTGNRFWGCGIDKDGTNYLGKMIMYKRHLIYANRQLQATQHTHVHEHLHKTQTTNPNEQDLQKVRENIQNENG
jgi:ribA/ribD-fused uncharacterized protein